MSNGNNEYFPDNVIVANQFFDQKDPIRRALQHLQAKENTLNKKNNRRAEQVADLKREYALLRLNNKRWNENDLETIAARAEKLEASYSLKINFPGAYNAEGSNKK